MEEFDLNNPNNLNPKLDKEKQIENWNNKPEVKNNHIKAIDTNKKIDISKSKLGFLKFLALLGVIALLIIAGVAGIYGYTLYKDKTLLNPVSLVCGNITIPACPNLPSIPTCPTCNCGDVNLTCPVIKIYNNGSVI